TLAPAKPDLTVVIGPTSEMAGLWPSERGRANNACSGEAGPHGGHWPDIGDGGPVAERARPGKQRLVRRSRTSRWSLARHRRWRAYGLTHSRTRKAPRPDAPLRACPSLTRPRAS